MDSVHEAIQTPSSVTHFVCPKGPEGASHHLVPSGPMDARVQRCTYCGETESHLRERNGL